VTSGRGVSLVFDTDVLVWVFRGNAKAARAVDRCAERAISIVTYMELLQGVRQQSESRAIKDFLGDLRFRTLPLTENTGHRASIYMEEYGLSVGLGVADSLIAATAVEANEPLFTGNDRHYNPIKELNLKRFRA
jgi:predicted nucleic acid-binding protein